jgi:hypothetical protein
LPAQVDRKALLQKVELPYDESYTPPPALPDQPTPPEGGPGGNGQAADGNVPVRSNGTPPGGNGRMAAGEMALSASRISEFLDDDGYALALNCGTGSGGFQAGNKCQKPGTGAGDAAAQSSERGTGADEGSRFPGTKVVSIRKSQFAGKLIDDVGNPVTVDDELTVYHVTSKERASELLKSGFDPANKAEGAKTIVGTEAEAKLLGKKVGDALDYEPGRGQGKGVYVGAAPAGLAHYGDTVLAIKVRAGDLSVPPERAAVYRMTPGKSLLLDDGYIEQKIPASSVKRVSLSGLSLSAAIDDADGYALALNCGTGAGGFQSGNTCAKGGRQFVVSKVTRAGMVHGRPVNESDPSLPPVELGHVSEFTAAETPLSASPLPEFAAKVQALGDKLPGFGDNKVYLSHVYEAAHAADPSLTVGEFKARMKAANTAGLLKLSRADLPLNPAEEARSEIELGHGATAHYLLVRSDPNRRQVARER